MGGEQTRFVAYAADDEREVRRELPGARSAGEAVDLAIRRFGPFTECVLLEADGTLQRAIWHRYGELGPRPAVRRAG